VIGIDGFDQVLEYRDRIFDLGIKKDAAALSGLKNEIIGSGVEGCYKQSLAKDIDRAVVGITGRSVAGQKESLGMYVAIGGILGFAGKCLLDYFLKSAGESISSDAENIITDKLMKLVGYGQQQSNFKSYNP
jgi:hypothetical protein